MVVIVILSFAKWLAEWLVTGLVKKPYDTKVDGDEILKFQGEEEVPHVRGEHLRIHLGPNSRDLAPNSRDPGPNSRDRRQQSAQVRKETGCSSCCAGDGDGDGAEFSAKE